MVVNTAKWATFVEQVSQVFGDIIYRASNGIHTPCTTPQTPVLPG